MTADGHSKGGATAVVPFSRTTRPLVIAPAGALFVTGCFMVAQKNVGPYLPIVLLLVVPFVYLVELVFVVPILWLWPRSRRPSVAIGAVWGAAAAWGFVLLLAVGAWYDPGEAFPQRFRVVPSTWAGWQDLGLLLLPGIASGVLFAYLSRKN